MKCVLGIGCVLVVSLMKEKRSDFQPHWVYDLIIYFTGHDRYADELNLVDNPPQFVCVCVFFIFCYCGSSPHVKKIYVLAIFLFNIHRELYCEMFIVCSIT